MLRSATSAEVSPLGLSSFPLVPYSNRIGCGTFVWAGQEIALTRNFLPEPHSIHGNGWQQEWTVSAQQPDSVALTYEHAGDAHWPWAFSASQQFILSPLGLTIHMAARNLADEAVPLAFGHHPYFDARGALLRFTARKIWMNGADNLPTHLIEPHGQFDFAQSCGLKDRIVDHCYTGWDGSARIDWAGRKYSLGVRSNLTAAVVYIPGGENYFCFEPVPHSNNAINRADADPAMPVVAPGAEFNAWIAFAAEPAA